jgi:transcription antitermination factor NusG
MNKMQTTYQATKANKNTKHFYVGDKVKIYLPNFPNSLGTIISVTNNNTKNYSLHIMFYRDTLIMKVDQVRSLLKRGYVEHYPYS